MHRPLRPLRRDLPSEGFFGVSEDTKCTFFMQAQPQMKFHPRAAQDLPLPSDFCGDLLKQGRREGLIKFRKLWPFQTTFANGRSVPLSPLPHCRPSRGSSLPAHYIHSYIHVYLAQTQKCAPIPRVTGWSLGFLGVLLKSHPNIQNSCEEVKRRAYAKMECYPPTG